MKVFVAGATGALGKQSGEVAVMAMTEVRRASNDKAKRELGWELRYPSWWQSFAEGLG